MITLQRSQLSFDSSGVIRSHPYSSLQSITHSQVLDTQSAGLSVPPSNLMNDLDSHLIPSLAHMEFRGFEYREGDEPDEEHD